VFSVVSHTIAVLGVPVVRSAYMRRRHAAAA
jgi:hypothetical protein